MKSKMCQMIFKPNHICFSSLSKTLHLNITDFEQNLIKDFVSWWIVELFSFFSNTLSNTSSLLLLSLSPFCDGLGLKMYNFLVTSFSHPKSRRPTCLVSITAYCLQLFGPILLLGCDTFMCFQQCFHTADFSPLFFSFSQLAWVYLRVWRTFFINFLLKKLKNINLKGISILS